ncbi:MAG: DinB family protein [Acidobacteria bacterium]|nr:DinB family protein [Acidobacteriota bacterium]
MSRTNHTSVVELLETTRRHIVSATRKFSESELNWKPAADAWSVNEVLAHLRCCADLWGESIEKILTQDQPSFRYVSPRGWIAKTNYLELEFNTSVRAFDQQRKDLLQTLRALPVEAWLRRAHVKAGTGVREETVLSYTKRLAEHELGHCQQIDRVLGALLLIRGR